MFVLTFFVLSLLGIILLFLLKRWEERSGRALAPRLRYRMDAGALRMHELLHALEKDIESLPPEAVHIGRALVRALALAAARGARFFELQLHRVADLVSHKHRFERPAPRSEFLNKIIEHKNGNGSGEQKHDPNS